MAGKVTGTWYGSGDGATSREDFLRHDDESKGMEE